MSYSVAVSSSGQITLPAALRKALGIGKRVTVEKKENEIIVKKEQTFREAMEEGHRQMLAYEAKHPEVAEKRKKYANMTVREMMDDWLESPEGKAEMLKELYG